MASARQPIRGLRRELPRKRVSIVLTGVGLALLVLLGLAYFVAPTHFAPDLTDVDLADIPVEQRLAARNDRLATQNDIRSTSLQLVAGIVVLGGAIAAWYQVQLRRGDQHIAREGQITERFTRAVDQLGNADSLDIRMGGIHALGRIAYESPQNRFGIVAVLAAYIVRSAPAGNAERRNSQPYPVGSAARYRSAVTRTPDVSVAIKALVGALQMATEDSQAITVDLRGSDLTGVDFSFVRLAVADLRNADLSNALLRFTDLTGADLAGANLAHADLSGANLTAADLRGADLTDADTIGAVLDMSKLTDEQRASLQFPDGFPD